MPRPCSIWAICCWNCRSGLKNGRLFPSSVIQTALLIWHNLQALGLCSFVLLESQSNFLLSEGTLQAQNNMQLWNYSPQKNIPALCRLQQRRTSSRNFCKSKHSISFLQMLMHPNKMGNLEMINLLCENSSKHIAASFPDGEIHVHQAFHQALRFTWMRLCVCSLCCFPAPAHIPPSLLCLFKEGLAMPKMWIHWPPSCVMFYL